MKNLLRVLSLAALSLGFSSCCSMFGLPASGAGYTTETVQVKTCHTDVVTEEVRVGGKGGMTELVERRVPRYKTVTRETRVPCPDCVRFYCPKKDCCGTTSEMVILMATAQPPVGSPHIGLIPTMKVLAE